MFADKAKYPNLQGVITQKGFFRGYTNINQVIYSLLPIFKPAFKALALILYVNFADKISSP